MEYKDFPDPIKFGLANLLICINAVHNSNTNDYVNRDIVNVGILVYEYIGEITNLLKISNDDNVINYNYDVSELDNYDYFGRLEFAIEYINNIDNLYRQFDLSENITIVMNKIILIKRIFLDLRNEYYENETSSDGENDENNNIN